MPASMMAVLGDLVEDIVVRPNGPINTASDTASHITRRRGGSAANVAASAAALGTRTRFLGQVGDDTIGAALLAELDSAGVDVTHARRAGSTGTIVALIDPTGERSMLTDRRACTDLADPDPTWLDDVTTLHIPLYSLVDGLIAATATTVIEWAHSRGIHVSIDLSSSAVIRAFGVERVHSMLDTLQPSAVLANLDEAVAAHIDGAVSGAVTVVKRGPDPAIVHVPGGPSFEVAATTSQSGVDTTGAGDAFAAGFLGVDLWWSNIRLAVEHGHDASARLLASRVGTVAS